MISKRESMKLKKTASDENMEVLLEIEEDDDLCDQD